MDVVGFGENSIDYLYRLPGLPAGGAGALGSGKVHVEGRTVLPGGQVATTMAACAALGLRTAYAGSFGNDEGAALVRRELTSRGVDLGHAVGREAPNRYAVILVDAASGERVVLWDRDDRLRSNPGEGRAEWLAGTRARHGDGVDEAASIVLARLGRTAGLHVTSDIETLTPSTAELIAAVTVPIFAEHVPAALTGLADPEQALRAIRRTHDGMLVVTLGARGAMLLHGDTLHHEPAVPVDVVDTTGAGDVFRAGLIHALLEGLPPRELLRFANAAAAVSCTRAGAMSSVPSLADVQRLLAPMTTKTV